ncbi:MAG: imidazole glycerol phosphate synthase subunit HisF [Bdellovibrionales bacterium]|nr:imidazole glycerol phosphate synthase subunit HisF [Bdellovibrionales bacterium]
MKNVRLISRLDIKGPNLIKGIHLEGLRVVGSPIEFARKYHEAGIDEIIYMDIVASLYGRNGLHDIVASAAREIMIPLTVGGGIRSVDDVQLAFRSGADKVAINTAVVHRPSLVSQVARQFGSQAMVGSIEAKRAGVGRWEVCTDNGREKAGLDVVEWAREVEKLGAGELLLTSVDQEGTRKGFDLDLIAAVSGAVGIPVIASGGMGKPEDLVSSVEAGADAVAMAHVLHYKQYTVAELRDYAQRHSLGVRTAP